MLGVPGTGKSVIKHALCRHEPSTSSPPSQRTLHTYTNTVRILCEAFHIEFEGARLSLRTPTHRAGPPPQPRRQVLTTILDDAHLMDLATCAAAPALRGLPQEPQPVLIGSPSCSAASTSPSTRTSRAASPTRSDQKARPRRHCGLHPAPNSTASASGTTPSPRRPRPHRPLRRRRPAQRPQPLRRLPDRGRPRSHKDHRHRQRQPRPDATPLANRADLAMTASLDPTASPDPPRFAALPMASSPSPCSGRSRPKFLPLLDEVCGRRGVMNYELCGRSRSRSVARARHELWWRIRNHPDLCFSYLEIARLFGCDHSTVCHGIHAHERRFQP